MNNDNAINGPQQPEDGSLKEHVGPDSGEKTEDRSTPLGSQPESHDAATESSTEPRDVEKGEPDDEQSAPVKVPRSRRRGLFGRFTILAEVEEPKHYSRTVKWYITFVVALAALAAPLGSAIIFRMIPKQTRKQASKP